VVLSMGGETIESCIAKATTAGLAYAGVQDHGWCFGGNTLGRGLVGNDECNAPCTANGAERCGGTWRNSVYGTGIPPGSCAPTTCAAQGKNCGSIPDGCGGSLSCGACASLETCGGGGAANVCGRCVPTTSCRAQGRSCGTIWDGCQSVRCGTCGVS